MFYRIYRDNINIKTWKDKMSGFPVFILGNGPSINDYQDLSILNNYFTIGINRIFYKIDPTILFWQDIDMVKYHERDIDKCNSIKVCRDKADNKKKYNNFILHKGDYKVTNSCDNLYGGGCSGVIAIQLAACMGFSKIILLGCDAKKINNITDFYGNNRFHKSHSIPNFYKGMKWVKENYNERIVSCSECDLWKRSNLQELIENSNFPKRNKFYYNCLLREINE